MPPVRTTSHAPPLVGSRRGFGSSRLHHQSEVDSTAEQGGEGDGAAARPHASSASSLVASRGGGGARREQGRRWRGGGHIGSLRPPSTTSSRRWPWRISSGARFRATVSPVAPVFVPAAEESTPRRRIKVAVVLARPRRRIDAAVSPRSRAVGERPGEVG
nr:unnamed protein product [Digitaria exilis]